MSEKANVQAPSKVETTVVKVKSLYNKHFPTDRRSYNLRIPFVGLIVSILTLCFVTTFIFKQFFSNNYNPNGNIAKYCYLFAATGVGYELYYGLDIGDRKQYTPWIILKIFEVFLTIVAIIYGCCDNQYHLSDVRGDMIYGSIVLAFNILILYVVVNKSLQQFRRPPAQTVEENIYDNYEDA